ncbi:heavy-metal-associated domain-containing protein [Sphingomonas solaris]|uniref:Heavy-metal-associated domain-containing protein n=1 Tax=Alterirhizorhabdus solaris TaxID=2529389 RepID=A0A558R093_9SPHN|nr:heavy-metal-associated domain-containing protein [Sphingomonas solaris]TVV72806.1 heavy-metal-associated domain-containing protein [Sphingomonas solaris]
MTFSPALRPLGRTLLIAALAAAGGAVWAQLEGGERGIAPINSSSSYEVMGVPVDVVGRTADAARTGGWRVAQRQGWKMLWARVNGRPVGEAPGLPDGTLDSIVAGIVVESEQIGPRRYVARLGVLFDRARTGQFLGGGGQVTRSAPMLVIPILYSGGAATSFEQRNEWQRAWARFRSGGSPVDYVRPVGNGSDPLLLNAAQTRRPGRAWWRLLLDQYGAADIVVPEVYLSRAFPGGPVTARFVARHGPDAQVIETFTLRAADADSMPAMLDDGVRRIDAAYAQALREGRLQPDASLVVEEPDAAPVNDTIAADETVDISAAPAAAGISGITLQVDTADAAALGQAEASLRGVPGVRSATTTSLALGGISLIRVQFEGDPAALRLALAARGWRVEDSGGGLRLRRAAPDAAPPAVPRP